VKESSVFTHRFNFDAREDAAGAIMISTRKHELNLLNCSYKTKITFRNFKKEKRVVRNGRVCLVRGEKILTAIPFEFLGKSPTRKSH
jgi:hypothetical protein